MNLTRKNSILTQGNVEELSSIKKFPIFIGATDQNYKDDIFSDLTLDICKDSGLIQLRNLIDSKLVYSNFHSEAIGKIWDDHHEKLSKIVSKYSFNKNILEIGGSNSKLVSKILDFNNFNKWTIIDPNINNKLQHKKINYIEKFFTSIEILNQNIKYNLIIHSHLLEHMIDPMKFLIEINNILDFNDYHIFSVPNLYQYLKNKYVNVINFEHTLFLTEEFIDYMLSFSNFKIIEKIYYKNHSIFYVTKKEKCEKRDIPNNYKHYKKMYLIFLDYYKNFIINLNRKLKETDKNIYLFGAHIFSQYLIFLGLDISKICYILDNSELKSGKRLYGTNLYIKMPKELDLNENSLIILKTGQYQNEIRKQILNINKNIEIYE